MFLRAAACPEGSLGGLACGGAALQGLGVNGTGGGVGAGAMTCGETGLLCIAGGSEFFSGNKREENTYTKVCGVSGETLTKCLLQTFF